MEATAPQQDIISTGYRPHRFQLYAHTYLKRFSVMVAHRRFGKTVFGINALIDAAVRCQLPMGRFGYVSPFLKQSKKNAWDYLKQYAMKIPGATKNEAELYVEFPNEGGHVSRITLFGADNPDSIRGSYFDGVVLDEYADMKQGVYTSIVLPMLSDRQGWVLFIGTPKGQDHFYKVFIDAQKRPDQWYAGEFRYDMTGLLRQTEIDLMRDEMSVNEFRREMLCDFTASTDDILITIDLATKAANRSMKIEEVANMPKILGVDVGRFGDDPSVIVKRQGSLIIGDPIILQGADNMKVASVVADHWRQWGADACFIDAGGGQGVIDRLKQLEYPVQEIHFGGSPTNDIFANKRAEMWWGLKEGMENGLAIPNHQGFIREICTPTYGYNRSGKRALEDKDAIKRRLGHSPDIGDAAALTYALPVYKTTGSILGDATLDIPIHQPSGEYDPHNAGF